MNQPTKANAGDDDRETRFLHEKDATPMRAYTGPTSFGRDKATPAKPANHATTMGSTNPWETEHGTKEINKLEKQKNQDKAYNKSTKLSHPSQAITKLPRVKPKCYELMPRHHSGKDPTLQSRRLRDLEVLFSGGRPGHPSFISASKANPPDLKNTAHRRVRAGWGKRGGGGQQGRWRRKGVKGGGGGEKMQIVGWDLKGRGDEEGVAEQKERGRWGREVAAPPPERPSCGGVGEGKGSRSGAG